MVKALIASQVNPSQSNNSYCKATRSQRRTTSCSFQSKYAMRYNVDPTFKTDNCVIRILTPELSNLDADRKHPDITSLAHQIPQSSTHRILERPLIGPIPQGEPLFYRQHIPRTCSLPTRSWAFLYFVDGCFAALSDDVVERTNN